MQESGGSCYSFLGPVFLKPFVSADFAQLAALPLAHVIASACLGPWMSFTAEVSKSVSASAASNGIPVVVQERAGIQMSGPNTFTIVAMMTDQQICRKISMLQKIRQPVCKDDLLRFGIPELAIASSMKTVRPLPART
jgi:hypothetical protein